MSCRGSSPELDCSRSVLSDPRLSPTPDDQGRSKNIPSPPRNILRPPPSLSQQRTVSEVAEEIFPPFDHRSEIVDPFEEENRRDADFREKLNKMLLDLMIEVHAWSTARPIFETNQNLESLEKEINTIMAIETEQGMSPQPSLTFIEKTRQRLGEFVNRIKMALAALTGMGI